MGARPRIRMQFDLNPNEAGHGGAVDTHVGCATKFVPRKTKGIVVRHEEIFAEADMAGHRRRAHKTSLRQPGTKIIRSPNLV
jgi:hypothetical protein